MGLSDWPVMVLAGPPGAGKTSVRKMLEGRDYPVERLIEAHVWPGWESAGPREIALRSVADLEALREAHPNCVLVWVEAPLAMRHIRLLTAAPSGHRPVVPDLRTFQQQHLVPVGGLQSAENARVLANPGLVESAAQQMLHNAGTLTELRAAAELLFEQCAAGFYRRLWGEKAPELGQPYRAAPSQAATRTRTRPVGRGLNDPIAIELPDHDISEKEAKERLNKTDQ